MSMEEQWNEIGEGDVELSDLIVTGVSRRSSTDPMIKVRRLLFFNALLGLVICIGYVALMLRFPAWQVLLCLGVVVSFSLWATLKALMLWNGMKHSSAFITVLAEMQRHYDSLGNWMKMQQRLAVFVYPPAAAAGFMIGGALGAGKPIGALMGQPLMVMAMLFVIALLAPACYYLAKWMSAKAFGPYAQQLKENIDSLKDHY